MWWARDSGLEVVDENHSVRSCGELREGEWIAALRNGAVHFIGEVGESMPEQGLFWATSATGERRIIEFREYDVVALQIP